MIMRKQRFFVAIWTLAIIATVSAFVLHLALAVDLFVPFLRSFLCTGKDLAGTTTTTTT